MRRQVASFCSAAILASALLLGGCNSFNLNDLNPLNRDSEVTAKDSPQTLFQKAKAQEQRGNFQTASELYDAIEKEFPSSPIATRSQLLSGYSLYRAEDYQGSIAVLDRFVALHPGNANVPYALYLKSLNSFDQISDVQRDQGETIQAKLAFEELLRRYPNSRYSADARQKILLTEDQLAGKEMAIGRAYQQQRHYLGAINRFRAVVERYQETAHIAEALHRLTESYLALGVVDEAQSAAAVLGHNYPRSSWYTRTYQLLTGRNLRPSLSERSWLRGVFQS